MANFTQMRNRILKYNEDDKKYHAELNARLNKEKDRFQQNYDNKNLYTFDLAAGRVRQLQVEVFGADDMSIRDRYQQDTSNYT